MTLIVDFEKLHSQNPELTPAKAVVRDVLI